MRDPDLLAQGTDAPAGSADDPHLDRLGLHGTKLHRLGRFLTAGAAGTSSPLHRDNYAVATNKGYGDAMGRGLELALTLVVMGGLGWLVDRVAGTEPLFTAIFGLVGFAGISVKLWLGYDLEMRRHDDGAVWSRGRSRTTAPADRDRATDGGNRTTGSGPQQGTVAS